MGMSEEFEKRTAINADYMLSAILKALGLVEDDDFGRDSEYTIYVRDLESRLFKGTITYSASEGMVIKKIL